MPVSSSGSIGSLPPTKCQAGMVFEPGTDQETPREIARRTRRPLPGGRREEMGQVVVHVAIVVRLVGRDAVEHAEGVVQRQVEGRRADQGRQPWEPARLPCRSIAIECGRQTGQARVSRKSMADLHRMAGLDRGPTPGRGDLHGRARAAPRAAPRSSSWLGQTHWTESGVSPQPSAAGPRRSSTVILTRAQVTSVVISGPNLSGTRVLIGRK